VTDRNPSVQTSLLRFLVPSLTGAAIFLLPVHVDDTWTILLGVVSDVLGVWIGDAMPAVLLAILSLSAVLSIGAATHAGFARRCARSELGRVFIVPRLWLAIRLLGVVCAWLIVFKLGPEFIWSPSTGGVALYDLGAKIVTIFFCAALLLPMLTDYGLMEFVGTLLQPLFRRCFTLPGRAAVDALASWLSSAAVGVLITISQYEQGNYTRREATVIACNFSVTSLPFCLFVISFIGLESYFFHIYATVVCIGLVCAVTLPRIPPLQRIPDEHAGGSVAQEAGDTRDHPPVTAALTAARQRAARGPGPRRYLLASAQHILDTWMGLIPTVVFVGTLSLALVEYTPIMQTIAAPLIPVLSWLGLPEAATAAPTFIVGFLDMFLPAAIGQSVESELTRFVIAAVSLTQLIYLSEVGAILLRSPLNPGMLALIKIFLLRSLIGLPIAIVAARLTLG
jgi:nucleoside recognition membrane protein YjiH